MALSSSKTKEAVAKPAEKTASASKAPKFLVKLLTMQQCQDPGTKVTLIKDKFIEVPEISSWVEFQATVNAVEIVAL